MTARYRNKTINIWLFYCYFIFVLQAYEFLLFAGLMVLDMLLFVAFSLKYQYTDYSSKKDDDLIGASLPTLASDFSN